MKLRVYRVIRFGNPSRPSETLGEVLAPHADMLRYDLGFHDPADPSRIVLPVFRHRVHGSTPRHTVTVARWESFSCKLQEDAGRFVDEQEAGAWVGYKHLPGGGTLVAETMGDFMAAASLKLTGERFMIR